MTRQTTSRLDPRALTEQLLLDQSDDQSSALQISWQREFRSELTTATRLICSMVSHRGGPCDGTFGPNGQPTSCSSDLFPLAATVILERSRKVARTWIEKNDQHPFGAYLRRSSTSHQSSWAQDLLRRWNTERGLTARPFRKDTAGFTPELDDEIAEVFARHAVTAELSESGTTDLTQLPAWRIADFLYMDACEPADTVIDVTRVSFLMFGPDSTGGLSKVISARGNEIGELLLDLDEVLSRRLPGERQYRNLVARARGITRIATVSKPKDTDAPISPPSVLDPKSSKRRPNAIAVSDRRVGLIIPIGARDVVPVEPHPVGTAPTPRDWTAGTLRSLGKKRSGVAARDLIRTPIIDRVLEEGELPQILDRIILVATDQKPPHRDDTVHSAALVTRSIGELVEADDLRIRNGISTHILRADPHLLRTTIQEMRHVLSDAAEALDEFAVVFAGGTPAMMMGTVIAANLTKLPVRIIQVPRQGQVDILDGLV